MTCPVRVRQCIQEWIGPSLTPHRSRLWNNMNPVLRNDWHDLMFTCRIWAENLDEPGLGDWYWAKYDTMTVSIFLGNLQRSVAFSINTSSTANNGVALELAIFETTNRIDTDCGKSSRARGVLPLQLCTIEFFVLQLDKFGNNAKIGIRSFTTWKQNNFGNKMLP